MERNLSQWQGSEKNKPKKRGYEKEEKFYREKEMWFKRTAWEEGESKLGRFREEWENKCEKVENERDKREREISYECIRKCIKGKEKVTMNGRVWKGE